ncbi:MAG: hypothetical protein QOF58_5789 [Pseudonocardiales bacterium]|jgi:hypothetical protein|nr:hypothetical protein [Pseudonocardiales bacterium]
MPELTGNTAGPRDIEDVLRDLHTTLAGEGNTRAAEQTFTMLVGAAAANEIMKSMERGDDEALRFHTDLLNECLESAEIPDFHVEW